MAIYAGFATNLDPEVMALRSPLAIPIGSGWISGWRFTFGGEAESWLGALPTIVEDPLSQVFVMLYDLRDQDIEELDSAEGYELGLYHKIRLRVATLDGDQTAWAYVLRAYEGGWPRRETLDSIVAAAIAANAPDDYISNLKNWRCAED